MNRDNSKQVEELLQEKKDDLKKEIGKFKQRRGTYTNQEIYSIIISWLYLYDKTFDSVQEWREELINLISDLLGATNHTDYFHGSPSKEMKEDKFYDLMTEYNKNQIDIDDLKDQLLS